MATKTRATLNYNDGTKSSLIISGAAIVGIFYSIAAKKKILPTIGITLGFAVGGVVLSVITSNLTD